MLFKVLYRFYPIDKEFVVENLMGVTRREIILTNSVKPKNRRRDSNMISVKQNFYTVLRP